VQADSTAYVYDAAGESSPETAASLLIGCQVRSECAGSRLADSSSPETPSRHLEAVSGPNVIATALDRAASDVGPFATPT